MNEPKLKKSFQLVKEDIGDLYSKLDDLSEKIDEMRINQRVLADKIVKKADKKTTNNSVKKKSSRKTKKKRR